jgi:hypothetical protein
MTVFPGRLISRFGDVTWPARSRWHCSTRLLPVVLCLKQGLWNTSCQYWWLKTQSSRLYSKNPQRNATTCYYSLSIATAVVYWRTWSPKKCHIQRVMTEMNYHGYGMHPIVLIKFFHFSLKCDFILKTGRFLWRTCIITSVFKGFVLECDVIDNYKVWNI